VVDTGALVGPSDYAGGAPGIDQLSAMPSLHVGWALIVGGGIIYASRRRWRWLAAAYPMVTIWVVVITGNHYEADGIVAAALVVTATAVVAAVRRRQSREGRQSRRWVPPVARPPTGVSHMDGAHRTTEKELIT
jgi:hypothetical protein